MAEERTGKRVGMSLDYQTYDNVVRDRARQVAERYPGLTDFVGYALFCLGVDDETFERVRDWILFGRGEMPVIEVLEVGPRRRAVEDLLLDRGATHTFSEVF